MKAWHFLNGTGKLGYDDNRVVKVGEKLSVEGGLKLCSFGLHGSKRILDALSYAENGSSLCRVELSGDILHGDDKSVASERTVLWQVGVEATGKILRKFACKCALDVIHLWEAPPIVLAYLKTQDEELRAASRDASRDAQNRRLTAMFCAEKSK